LIGKSKKKSILENTHITNMRLSISKQMSFQDIVVLYHPSPPPEIKIPEIPFGNNSTLKILNSHLFPIGLELWLHHQLYNSKRYKQHQKRNDQHNTDNKRFVSMP